jgi:uncharacterized protein YggE
MMPRLPAVLFALAFSLAAAGSGQAAVEIPFPLVTVAGEASVNLIPDLAQTSAGVSTEAKTVREATEANSQAMNAVVAALKDAGIADRDIKTARFAIHPVYAAPRQGRLEEQRLTGYRVSNQVTVKIRDVGKVGDVLDRLTAAGATDVSGISFTVSEPAKPLEEARAAAVADARRKAEIYAQAAGAQVGRVVSIAENGAGAPRPFSMAAPRAMAAAAPPPIAPGEETLRVAVTVSFELLR